MSHLIQNKISYYSADDIAIYTCTLQKYGISGFVHDITFGKGQISLLTDRKEIYEFYYKTGYPAIFTNDTGRILPPGIYYDRKLKDFDNEYSQLISNVKNNIKFKRLLHIVENELNFQYLYTFIFDLDEVNFLHSIINNIENIKSFLFYYKNTFNDLITKVMHPKNRFTLPFSCETKETLNIFDRENTYLKFLISKREKECLHLTIRGKSAKQVASELGISPRTVEEYLNNAKRKFGVFSKPELIDKALDYFHEL